MKKEGYYLRFLSHSSGTVLPVLSAPFGSLYSCISLQTINFLQLSPEYFSVHSYFYIDHIIFEVFYCISHSHSSL